MTGERTASEGAAGRAPHTAARALLRAALIALVVGSVLAGLCAPVAALVAGGAAFGGALVGCVLTAAVLGTSVLSAWLAPRSGPGGGAALVLGAWLAKIVLVAASLFLLRDAETISPLWTCIALLAGVLPGILVELVLLGRTRVPLDLTP